MLYEGTVHLVSIFYNDRSQSILKTTWNTKQAYVSFETENLNYQTIFINATLKFREKNPNYYVLTFKNKYTFFLLILKDKLIMISCSLFYHWKQCFENFISWNLGSEIENLKGFLQLVKFNYISSTCS